MKWLSCIFGISLLGQTLTLEKERVLSAGLVAEVRKHVKPFDNADVTAYVERVGRCLAALVPYNALQFEVVVAEGTEPSGLPGGFVLVPAPFLLMAEDEAEFAGMVAHAMGHAILRHSFLTANKPQAGQIPLLFMGGWMGVHVDTAHRNLMVPLAFLEAVRRNELEADRFGADLAGRAGYDPAALARYFRRVQPEDSARSPLPAKADRLAALEDTAGRGGEVGGSDFLRAREMVRAALPGVQRKPPSLRW